VSPQRHTKPTVSPPLRSLSQISEKIYHDGRTLDGLTLTNAVSGVTVEGLVVVGTFKAIVVDKTDSGQSVALTDFDEAGLMEGSVVLRPEWSTVNYKDGLAITNKAPVVRRFPMIAGVDGAGTVETSTHPDWKSGDKFILNGCGCGETHLGLYAQKARVNGDWLISLPAKFSARDAMAIGTAGVTAMLSVMALERSGVTPDRGPIIVTGAAGGVGSTAVALLAKLGYQITASTGRPEEEGYLKSLGASEVIARSELTGPVRPLAKERFAGGIDSVGSTTLANVLSMIRYGGAVAACGLAAGIDLPTTVAPFILRGISLIGIESVYASKLIRKEAWTRLGEDLDMNKLSEMTAEIGLADTIEAGKKIVNGRVRGRLVVKIG
jgi:acrylyl-CoA reductase (NADPH)